MENQTKIEEVTTLDISLIDDFEGHPFTVKDDENMEELARSKRNYARAKGQTKREN